MTLRKLCPTCGQPDHSRTIKQGLRKAKASGIKLGRKPLDDDKVEAIKSARAKGLSLRAIAEEVHVAVGTVAKIVKVS